MNAQTNDMLRKLIPFIQPPNLLVATVGIMSLGTDEVVDILHKVRQFDNFNNDNDPWGQHDFGSFEHKSEKIFWKIDDYAGQQGYNLILTVMLAKEY